MKSTLDKIIEYKREELSALKRRVTLKDVRLKADDASPAIPFLGGFRKNQINIIAEVKKASPSVGVIREDFRPVEFARIYEDAGAKALSILTDEHFFQGRLDFLSSIKKAVAIPCLRKDFMVSEYQFFEARGAGADAVLLIAAVLDAFQIRDYQALARELGMTVLVEVHDAEELEKISPLDCNCIGVNNRDLKTFKVSLDTSLELGPRIPKSAKRISESGLNTRDDLEKLARAGYDGFLIGESLMREEDIAKKLRELTCPL